MNDSSVKEIDVMKPIYHVLSKWRMLIIGALIGALLFGALGAFRAGRTSPDEASLKEEKATYEDELKAYETNKENLQNRIANLENNIEQQQYIQERSVMLEMDPYNIYETVLSYYVDTNYEIMPELYYQDPNYTAVITNSYYSAIMRLDISEFFVTPERPEVLTDNPVSGNGERLLSVSVDAGQGTFTITARADTQENLDRLTQAIQDTVDETKKLLNKTIRTHTLSVLDSKTGQTVDFDYTDLQQSFDDNIYNLTQSLTEANDSLSALEEPKAPAEASADVKKTAAKYGIIGLILGLGLVVLIYVFRLVAMDPVLSPDDIGERYQIPVLGIYTEKDRKSRNKLDQCIVGKLGIPKADHEESVSYIKAKRALYPLEQEILLVSTSASDCLQEVSEVLSKADSGTNYAAGGDLSSSAAAVDALNGAKSVICVEKWLKSSHEDVKKELAMIRQAVSPEKIAMILIQ